MEKVRYMISDAAAMAGVETHVLRYWEDELDLTIPRNEMGHRYYTSENIQEFKRIKELKEKGYQLKAIRAILHNGEEAETPNEKNVQPVHNDPLPSQQKASPAAAPVNIPQVQEMGKPVYPCVREADGRRTGTDQ